MAGQATTPAHVSLQPGTAPHAQTMSASLVNGMDPAAAAACDEILAKATDLAIRPFVIGQWSKCNEVRTATIAVENTPESPPVLTLTVECYGEYNFNASVLLPDGRAAMTFRSGSSTSTMFNGPPAPSPVFYGGQAMAAVSERSSGFCDTSSAGVYVEHNTGDPAADTFLSHPGCNLQAQVMCCSVVFFLPTFGLSMCLLLHSLGFDREKLLKQAGKGGAPLGGSATHTHRVLPGAEQGPKGCACFPGRGGQGIAVALGSMPLDRKRDALAAAVYDACMLWTAPVGNQGGA